MYLVYLSQLTIIVLIIIVNLSSTASGNQDGRFGAPATAKAEGFFKGKRHSNNWAVLVCSSRYWFNYRHVANVLSIYRSVKRMGIPDSRIIMMLSDDMACNSRNPVPGTVFNNAHHHINVYGDDVEVDYRGYEVTVHNFIRLLTGRVNTGTPKSKQLLTDERSNILIYMTGHGGNGFLKFQDSEEITSVELADAFEQMHQKGRYNEILLITETCQAESMAELIYSPNIIGIGSSKIGEDSLAHHGDPSIGVYVIDRYTNYALEYLEKVSMNSTHTLETFFEVCPKRVCISTVTVKKSNYRRQTNKVLLTDFFSSLPEIRLLDTRGDNRQFNFTFNQDDDDKRNQVNDNDERQFTLYKNYQRKSNWKYLNSFPISIS